MKKLLGLLICLLFIFPTIAYAVDYELDWYATWGGNEYEEAVSIIEDKDGNYVLVGTTRSTNIESFNGIPGGIILKYDTNGNLIWEKVYPKTMFYEVNQDNGGNYLVAGTNGIYIFDKNGDVIFTEILDDSRYNSIKPTSDGGFITAGAINEKASLRKYNSQYKLEWEKNWTSPKKEGNSYFINVLQLKDGSYIANGITDPINNDDDFSMMVKYNAKGEEQWAKPAKLINGYIYHTGTVTSDGSYILTGFTDELTDKTDAYINKYDSDGNIIWQYKLEGNGTDNIVGITEMKDQSILLTGFSGSTDIPDFENKGLYDAIIIKLDKNGDKVWIKNWGTNLLDGFVTTTLNSKSDILALGMTTSLELENINPEDIVEKEVLLLKFKLVYEISKKENQTESTEGSFTVKQEDDKGIIETTPNKGYIVEDVIVTDSKDEEVPVTKEEENKYTFDITDDVEIEVTFEKDYKITILETKNGKITAEKDENNLVKIKSQADKNYELEKLIVTNSKNEKVEVKLENGYYVFYINDDVTVKGTFIKIPTNPKTGVENFLSLLFVIVSGMSITGYIINKKNVFKQI